MATPSTKQGSAPLLSGFFEKKGDPPQADQLWLWEKGDHPGTASGLVSRRSCNVSCTRGEREDGWVERAKRRRIRRTRSCTRMVFRRLDEWITQDGSTPRDTYRQSASPERTSPARRTSTFGRRVEGSTFTRSMCQCAKKSNVRRLEWVKMVVLSRCRRLNEHLTSREMILPVQRFSRHRFHARSSQRQGTRRRAWQRLSMLGRQLGPGGFVAILVVGGQSNNGKINSKENTKSPD